MSRLRIFGLCLVALAAGAAAVLPTLASGSVPNSASFTAVDFSWGADGGGSTATISQGGTVSFSYPTGASDHNADFGTKSPSACTQTAGSSSGSVPPLPASPTAPGWSGTCTFNTPGTYTFHCDLHPSMTGTIVVQAPTTTTSSTSTAGTTSSTATTGTTQTSSTTTSSTTTSAAPTSAGGSPLAGSTTKAIHVAGRQRGATIHGSLKIASSGAGGTLTLSAFATRASLKHAIAAAAVPIGRRSFRLRAGTFRFSLTLSRPARQALARARRLQVTLVIVATSRAGRRMRTSRHVVMTA